MIPTIMIHTMIPTIVPGALGFRLALASDLAWALAMVAGVTPTMAGVIHTMAGVTHPTAGVILITVMDHTGRVIIVDTGMGITMAVVDTIIPPLITPILMEDAVTGMVTASPGQVSRDMVPGA